MMGMESVLAVWGGSQRFPPQNTISQIDFPPPAPPSSFGAILFPVFFLLDHKQYTLTPPFRQQSAIDKPRYFNQSTSNDGRHQQLHPGDAKAIGRDV